MASSRPVMSIILNDIPTSLTYTIQEIKDTLAKGGFGLVNVTKNFLSDDSSATYMKRDVNNKRKKCEVFLDTPPPNAVKKLKAGKQLHV